MDELCIEAIKAREAAATPGPWSWRGYSNEDPCLFGARTRVVLSVIRREREADDPETRDFVSHLHNCDMPEVDSEGNTTWRPLSDEEVADRVKVEWLNDPWGGPAYDNRLAFRDHGTNLMECARDITVAEHPDAEFIRHARADIPALLREIERMRVEIQRLTDSEDSRVVLLEAEDKRLREELGRLNNAITWYTSCLNCSTLLDASYAETVRAEKAEAGRDRYKGLFDHLVVDRRRLIGLLRERNYKLKRAEAVLDAAAVRAEVLRDLAEFGSGSDGWTDRDRESDRAILAAVNAYEACPACGPGGCAGHTKAVAK